MLKLYHLKVGALALMATVGLTGMAQAQLTGWFWETSDAAARNAAPSNPVYATPFTDTFTLPGLPISLNPTDSSSIYTIGSFLASGGATYTGSHGADPLDDTLFEITGTINVSNGETFTTFHDDGITIVIGGVTVLSNPGPNSLTENTAVWTGGNGPEPIAIYYGECCGPPASLQVMATASTIPEAPTSAMMLVGFAGLGFAGYRTSSHLDGRLSVHRRSTLERPPRGGLSA